MFQLDDEFDVDVNFLDDVLNVSENDVKYVNTDQRQSSEQKKRKVYKLANVDSVEISPSTSILNFRSSSSSFGGSLNSSFGNPSNDTLRDGRKIVARKFPGPAGLLPERQVNTSLVATEEFLTQLDQPSCPENLLQDEGLLSQNTAVSLEGGPWRNMLDSLGNSAVVKELLSASTLSTILTRAKQRRSSPGTGMRSSPFRVPFLAAFIQSVDASSSDPCMMLHDTTGEMYAAVHREAWEILAQNFLPGTVIVLVNVGVVSSGITSTSHYLNITQRNIVSIFSPTKEDEVRVTRLKNLQESDYCSLLNLWSSVHAGPQVSTPSPVRNHSNHKQALALKTHNKGTMLWNSLPQTPKTIKRISSSDVSSSSPEIGLISSSNGNVDASSQSMVESLLDGLDKESLFGDF